MIILLGSVGSGKTEQGERLAKKLKCPRVSTSQLLRNHATSTIDSDIHAGRLVNDQQLLKLLEPALLRATKEHQEFVLDGAPRSLPQAQWLVRQIKQGNLQLTGIINLNVSDSEVIKRLLKRHREDDQEEIILKRLNDYHNITIPVIAYLNSKGLEVIQINGENPPAKVEAEIKKALDL